MILTIQVKRDEHGCWLALMPGHHHKHGWLLTPFFGPATFADVKASLADRNPGYLIEEV